MSSFAFAGVGYDRAAHLRSDLDTHLADHDKCTIVLWKGKVLYGCGALVRLPLSHPALTAGRKPIFLGLAPNAVFATDISDWEPEGVEAPLSDDFWNPDEQAHPLVPDAAFVELRSVLTQLSALDAELAATARSITGWHQSHRFCSRCGVASEPAMGGWQRTCPDCGGHHFPRTDPVVIMLVTHEDKVLLGRSPHFPQGMYSTLAGFIEPGETIEAAVRREVKEEVNVEIGKVTYMASQPWPFPSSLMIGCHAEAITTQITNDPEEIEDALWLSLGEMRQVFEGTHDIVSAPREGAIAAWMLSTWVAQSGE